MGASNPYNSGESSSSAKPELADFLLARMKELRVTFRVLEASTPMMKRTRLHCILHSDTGQAPADARGRGPRRSAPRSASRQSEAFFGTELLGCMSGDDREEAAGLTSFLATMFGGLAPRLANAVSAIGGLDLSDVKGEHGQQIQQLVCETFERGYADLAERKGLRLRKREADGL